jgi:hypothetical protein
VPRYRVSVIAVAARNKGLDPRQGEVVAGFGLIHGRRGSGGQKLEAGSLLQLGAGSGSDGGVRGAVELPSIRVRRDAPRSGWDGSPLESRPTSEARREGGGHGSLVKSSKLAGWRASDWVGTRASALGAGRCSFVRSVSGAARRRADNPVH